MFRVVLASQESVTGAPSMLTVLPAGYSPRGGDKLRRGREKNKAKLRSLAPLEPAIIRPMDSDFARELMRFGPESARGPVNLAQARAYCRRLAQSHYEN